MSADLKLSSSVFKYTKHQVARASRPDGETFDSFYPIKRVSELRATYQIRLLLFFALEQNKKLVVEVPRGCKIHQSLRDLAGTYQGNLKIEQV